MVYNKEFYKQSYDWLHALLLELSINRDEDRADIEGVKKFVSIYDADCVEKTVYQIEEVLELELLPIEWIEDIIRSRPLQAREWLKRIAQALKEEAKKAGKL